MDVARVMEAMVQADGGNQNGKRAGQVDKSSRAKRCVLMFSYSFRH